MIELYILLSLLFAAWYLADNIVHAEDVSSYRILALETFFVLIAWPLLLFIVFIAGLEKAMFTCSQVL